MTWLGKLMCFMGRHGRPPGWRGGLYVCTRRGCMQLCSRERR